MKKKPIIQKKLSTNQVILKDWLAMKPYDAPINNYDVFYLRQCQVVHGYFVENGALFQQWDLSRPQLKELSCQIVSYFEDYIVEIGIWSAFIETNKALYGYALPFYDLSEYDESYINIEDIAFLIWHYVTKYSEEEYIVNPDHEVIMELSEAIFDLFENVMEQAPAIDLYDNIFTIKDDESYFVFKTTMKWFSTESYLLGVDLGKKYRVSVGDLMEHGRKVGAKPEHLNIVLYSFMENYLYKKRSSFSALNAPEWFAKIAKCSDTRRQEILDTTYWIEGKFFLQERKSKHFVFEHLLTKMRYNVKIDSFQNKEMRPSGTMAYDMHLIRWNEEYLLSGMMQGAPITESEIKRYKTEPIKMPWILPEKTLKSMQESVELMYKTFIEFFKAPLVVFKTSAQLEKANMDYLEYYRNFIIEKNKDFTREGSFKEDMQKFKEKYRKEDVSFEKEFNKDGGKRSVSLFFIENVGTYVTEGVGEVIQDLKATSLSGQERADLFISFANGYIPSVCTYLLEQYGTKNLKFPILDNNVDVVKHLPFFWRMNSPEEFDRTYPLITEIDVEILD